MTSVFDHPTYGWVYHVVYQDGDAEDLTEVALRKYVVHRPSEEDRSDVEWEETSLDDQIEIQA